MTKKLEAPIEIELNIKITNGNGNTGTVTIGMGNGWYPTDQELRDRVAKFASEEMPDGFRLLTKREWFNDLFGQCREEDDDGNPTLIDFAMPGSANWDE